MLLVACFLLLQVGLSYENSMKERAQFPYGREAPANGKLIHDMRTFINITFDWSSRNYSQHGEFVIPRCHERTIRRTFYERAEDMLGIAVLDILFPEREMQTGHLLYPLTITVINGTEPRRDYFSVALHRVYSSDDAHHVAHLWPYYPHSPLNKELKLIENILVSEKTWSDVWGLWIAAEKKGLDLCDGGRHFDSVLPNIYRDSEYKPQLDDLLQNYTDLTSDTCGLVRCGATPNQTETITYAFPTIDGIQHIVSSPHLIGSSAEKSIAFLRYKSDNRVLDCVMDYYQERRYGRYDVNEADAKAYKHRICELKEAVERLNQQYKYIRFDQDVIKFVKEVTGKSPIELRNERNQITADLITDVGVKSEPETSLETLNNLTEQSINKRKSNITDPFDVAVVKEESADYPEQMEIEKMQATVELELSRDYRKRKMEEEEEIDVKRIKAEAENENELHANKCDQALLSSAKLLDFGFLPSSQPCVSFYGEMVFLVQWGTGEKTWQPWAEFKDNTDLIFKLVLRFIRKHFTCNAEEKKLFESKTGVQLHCDATKNRSFFTRIIYIPPSGE